MARRRSRRNPSTEVHEDYARKYLRETDNLLATSRQFFEAGDGMQGWRYLLDAYESVAEGNAELVHLLEDPAFDEHASKHLLDDLNNLQQSMRETILHGLAADVAAAGALRPRLVVIKGGLDNPATRGPLPLHTIRVLFREPDTLSLWGIPYAMRRGQQPGDLWRARRDAEDARISSSFAPRPIDLSDWIWLGTPGWYGSHTRADIAAIKAFLEQHADWVPQGPYEWMELPT